MRCDFCGEEIEGQPFQKDGMNFCSLECSDAMETGESIHLGDEIIEDPDEDDADGDNKHDDAPFEDEFSDHDIFSDKDGDF